MTKYQILKRELLDKVASHEYAIGSPFPSQNTLMRRYKMSYSTVARALQELQEAGIIERIRGRGSFVSSMDVRQAMTGKNDNNFTVKMVVPEELDHRSGAMDIYQGLLTRALECGLRVCNIPFSDDTQMLESFFNYNDFFFLTDVSGYDVRIIAELNARNIPFVVRAAFEDMQYAVNAVTVDVRTPTAKLTAELIASGRKDIVFLSHPINKWSAPKLRGYSDAMKAAGLKPETWTVPESYSEAGAKFDEFLAEKTPQAIVAVTDLYGFEAIDRLKRRGLRIPEDVAIAGASNVPKAEAPDTSLTSIDYPKQEIGSVAVDWMLHLRQHPEIEPAIKIITPKIFYRNSFPKP